MVKAFDFCRSALMTETTLLDYGSLVLVNENLAALLDHWWDVLVVYCGRCYIHSSTVEIVV